MEDELRDVRRLGRAVDRRLLRTAKQYGFSDRQLADDLRHAPRWRSASDRKQLRHRRRRSSRSTPAPPSSRPTRRTTTPPTKTKTKSPPKQPGKKRIMILGGGPNRIGQGIEFDYCCCHASFALRELGIESVMVNSNPETVSTDYDTSDLLFFEPLTVEDVLNICDRVQPDGVIVQFGGQTPLNLARALADAGVPIIGTSVDTIEAAEDREKFQQLLAPAGPASSRPTASPARWTRPGARPSKIGYPDARAAELRARRPGDGDLLRPVAARAVRGRGVHRRRRASRC